MSETPGDSRIGPNPQAAPSNEVEPPAPSPSPFGRIVCGLDGSRDASEALHQAIALCGPEQTLHLVVVCDLLGDDLPEEVNAREMQARNVLDEATAIVRKAGLEASASILRGSSVSDLLLAEVSAQDLLVIGGHHDSGLGGVMLSKTTAEIAHLAEGPVLVARRTAAGDQFPQSVLLATDGTPASWAAARTATRLAERRRSELRVVYAPDGMHPERYRQVLKQLAMIEKATGSSPKVFDNPAGHVAEQICEAAQASQASLIVIGHRGLKSVKALGSVSEQVVHRAPCSVLVVPAVDDVG